MNDSINLFNERRKKRIEERKDEEDITWISTKEGAHIPLVDGESIGGWSKGKKFNQTGTDRDFFSEFENNGTYINESIKKYKGNKNLNNVLKGVNDVYSDFGMNTSEIKGIGVDGVGLKTHNEAASINGAGDLTVRKLLLDNDNFDKEEKDGYTINNTSYGVGTHEAGHGIMGKMYKTLPLELLYGGKVPEKYLSENYARSMARKDQRLEKMILKEAKQRYGSNPVISKYGSTKFAEKVAEAFCDVYSNGDKAKEYSHVIVDIAKEYFKRK